MAHSITTLAELLQKLRPQLPHVQKLQSAVIDAIDSEAEAALCIRTLTGLLKDLRPQIERFPEVYLLFAFGGDSNHFTGA